MLLVSVDPIAIKTKNKTRNNVGIVYREMPISLNRVTQVPDLRLFQRLCDA